MSDSLEIVTGVVVPPFVEFPSIARLARDVVVTEKLDGTNAQVHITEDGRMYAGSRTRWVTPLSDNFGFASWVQEHRDELMQLGPGSHFGEWWGQDIQRKYNIGERRFSLFNVTRWGDDAVRPACCHVVPTLYAGIFDTAQIEATLTLLGAAGSVAAPGFMNPEGVVVYHEKSRTLFKKTLGDDGHKGARRGGAA
ncbi:MAG: hypothetical protein EKK62_17080 [Acidimicrobiia bacterium]|nr:MAG: hypothetical protein EKK62_17080 [Acidimicrobiia bacterium]